jgi:hypothetical protein
MRLIQNAVMDEPMKPRDQLIFLAKKIGAQSFATVLDEIGNDRPYLPTRHRFFMDMFRPVRIQLTMGYRAEGRSYPEIAKLLGVSERTVDVDIRAGCTSPLRRFVW